jgi:hypothetical protein
MAIVQYKGQGYVNAVAFQSPQKDFAEAVDKNIYSLAAIANGDSIGSQFYIGRVPTDARLLFHNSLILTSANAGLTSVSVGLANPAQDISSPPAGAGLMIAAGALANAVNMAAANSFNLGPATGNWFKRFWQLAGLAADPGGYFDVIATLNTASGAASTMEAFLQYVRGGP